MPKKKTAKPAPAETTAPPGDAPALPPAAQIVLALLDAESGTTAADMSDRAGLARSTVTKALATLLDQGMAVRQEGGHEGARRIADRWFAAPGAQARVAATGGDRTEALPEADAPDGVEPNGEAVEEEKADEPTGVDAADGDIADEQTPATQDGAAPEEPGTDLAEPADPDSQGPEARDAGPVSASNGADERSRAGADAADGSESTPVAAADGDGGVSRRGKGELRAMVEEHLRADPDRAWTPTAISKVLNRSAGAINNACVKLSETGVVTTLPDKPVRFQWTGAGAADAY